MLSEDLLVLAVVGGLQGLREVRALLVDHLDDHAQRLGHDEDVGEYYGGVYQAVKAVDGLKGQGRGDFRIATALEEIAGALRLMVLG